MTDADDPTPIDGHVRTSYSGDDDIDRGALGDLARESDESTGHASTDQVPTDPDGSATPSDELATGQISTGQDDAEAVTGQLDPERTRVMSPTERRVVTPPYGQPIHADRVPAATPVATSTSARSRSWWRRGRTWWLLILAVAALVAGYYLVTVFQVVMAGRADDARPSDAIVVLGAAQYDGRPSPQLAARLDHAVDLYDADIAPIVMVTGGKLPGDRFTEAEASRAYLIDHGVPESAILMENAGRTTYESMESAAQILGDAGLDTVVLVTDPFHTLRSQMIAEEVGLDPVSSPTPTTVVHGWNEVRRDLVEAGGVAIGRLIGFERLSGLSG